VELREGSGRAGGSLCLVGLFGLVVSASLWPCWRAGQRLHVCERRRRPAAATAPTRGGHHPTCAHAALAGADAAGRAVLLGGRGAKAGGAVARLAARLAFVALGWAGGPHAHVCKRRVETFV
jgi:hypothetical protein